MTLAVSQLLGQASPGRRGVIAILLTLAGIASLIGLDALAGRLTWSDLIGCILAATAAALIYETKALLIGEAADPAVAATVRQVIAERPEILTTNEVLTMHLGPRDILVNISVDFRDDLDAAGVERAITEMEGLIKQASPEVKRIFIEAQAWHASRRMAAETNQHP